MGDSKAISLRDTYPPRTWAVDSANNNEPATLALIHCIEDVGMTKIASVPLLILVALVTGCGSTSTLQIPSGYVRANSAQFNVVSLQKSTAYIVTTPDFQGYQFKKDAYSAMGGALFPNHLTFEIGNAVADEFNSMAISLFAKTARYQSLSEATAAAGGAPNFIVVPEFDAVSLDLPTVRFTDIDASVSVKYSVYDAKGEFIRSGIAVGEGKKALEFTQQNYVIAFQEAIKDLMLKSKEVIAGLASAKQRGQTP